MLHCDCLMQPQTGKTHQLRVAMKSNGVPILGDPMYSAIEDSQEDDRCYLHAAALRLPLLEGNCADDGDVLHGDSNSCDRQTLDVVLPPDEGIEFCSPEFQSAFETHFMDAVADQVTWFADTKALSSSSAGQPRLMT